MILNLQEVLGTAVIGLALLAGWIGVRILISDWRECRKQKERME